MVIPPGAVGVADAAGAVSVEGALGCCTGVRVRSLWTGCVDFRGGGGVLSLLGGAGGGGSIAGAG
jgi:hypothetical protein